MKSSPYRAQFAAYVLAMMADNIEHVISYWVVFQKFHSPALAGFAVLSHWLPFLLFSVAVGALADRFDPRASSSAACCCSSSPRGWGNLLPHRHACRCGTRWCCWSCTAAPACCGRRRTSCCSTTSSDPPHLPSAVRLNATARYLGMLVGPAVGGVIMLTLGPSYGILFNTLFYLPTAALAVVGADRERKDRRRPAASPVRGLADIVQTIRDIATQPVLTSMTLLAGLTSFLVGNGYQAQMPGFASDLGHGDPGMSYSMLLAADAAGALLAGIALEAWGLLRPTARTAIILAMLWCTVPARLRGHVTSTRWRSRCSSPQGSSSCRSTRWRRRWCR